MNHFWLSSPIKMGMLIIFTFVTYFMSAQTGYVLKVHFLYGSKPAKGFRKTEKVWFGGMLGGHVGIEYDSNKIIDFVPADRFHIISHTHNRHSMFKLRNNEEFYSTFGSPACDVKKLIITVPISYSQKQQLDSIVNAYANEVPYDYAFFGMRCAAAAFDILTKLQILPSCSCWKMKWKMFYPKLLRRRMINLALNNKYATNSQAGCLRRVWENDK